MRASGEATPSSSPLLAVLGIGGLYVGQSVIGGITWTGLPAIMRANGVGLDEIGYVSLIALPWALKFLWSPLVEQYRLPATGRSRSAEIVIAGGLVCVIGLLLAGFLDPARAAPLLLCLTAVAFAAATVDIACDGFAVQTLQKSQHGWGNAAQVGGAYLGSAIGGGLFLYLFGKAGWGPASWLMALALILLALPFLLGPARAGKPEERQHVPSLKTAIASAPLRRGLTVSALFVLAQKTSMGMVGPFLIDRGFDVATIGVLNGLASLTIGFGAALLSGLCVSTWGVRPVLVISLLAQALMLALLAVAALSDLLPSGAIVAVAAVSTSGVLAFGFVPLYAQFMRWADSRQPGIDFTLFQCMDALVSIIGGMIAGHLANSFGYGSFFISAAMLALFSGPALYTATSPTSDR